MKRAALAAALAVALAGCGSSSSTGSAGRASLWVTRDHGAHVLYSTSVPAGESVLQALDRVAKIKTRFGGHYLRGVDGLEEHGNRAWFYYVNGYLADRSAGDYRLRAGDVAWWDYRQWHDPLEFPVVLGAFPQPFLSGYDGERHPTVVLSTDPRARAVAKRLHGRVGRRAPADANVVVLGGDATTITLRRASPGAPVRLVFDGDPRKLLEPRPFRYRYEVGG